MAAFGNVDVYVPEGVNVDVGGITVFGHRRDWGRDADRPDAPTVHVRVLGFAGTIDVWRVPQDMGPPAIATSSASFRTASASFPRERPAGEAGTERPAVLANRMRMKR